MRNAEEFAPPIQARLDRLVDGELSHGEYSEMLRWLDAQPDGWRQCAMAFLEAQAWQREIGGLTDRDLGQAAAVRHETPVEVPSQVARPNASSSASWPLLLAVAASFLIVFGIGNWVGPFWKPPTADRSPQLVVDDSLGESPDFDTVGSQPPVAPAGDLAYASQPDDSALFYVDGPQSAPVQVPTVEWRPEHGDSLFRDNVRIPPDVQRASDRMGGDMRFNRHLMPVQTRNGRRALVPMDQFEITPVGRHRYQ